MADTLTGLIPDIYEAMDIVSREKVGLLQSVMVDAKGESVAKGQSVVADIAPTVAAGDITPAAVPSAATDLTEGTASVTMDFSRAAAFNFSGLSERTLNTSIGANNTKAGRIAQALRTLDNEMDAAIAALHTKASRAYGTAATTPFASNLGEAAQIEKILSDNGAPAFGRSLVFNTTAGANLRSLPAFNGVNTVGSDAVQRRGELLDVFGMSLKESANIATSTAGTAALATTDNAGYSVGDTVITLASAGTGTIVAGDVITFAGDTNKYVVVSGDTDTSDGGTITLAAPGLRVAMSAATKAITMVAAAARNMAFTQDAIAFVTALPERPSDGDGADDVIAITSPVSGITYEFAKYGGYRQNRYEIGINYGTAVIKPEHLCLLLG